MLPSYIKKVPPFLIPIAILYILGILFLTRTHYGLPFEFHPRADDGWYLLYAHNIIFKGQLGFSGDVCTLGLPTLTANPFSAGPGLIWLIPGLFVRVLIPFLDCVGGCCPEVYAWFGGVGVSLTFGGMIFLFVAGKRWFSSSISLLATAAVTFSTIVPYYLFFRTLMAHGAEFFLVSGILCMLAWTKPNPDKSMDFLFGVLCGLLTITRFQDVVWIPSFFLIRMALQKHSSIPWKNILWVCLGFIIAVLPQLVYFVIQRQGVPSSLNSLYQINDPQNTLSAYFGLFPGWFGRITKVLWGPGFGYFSLSPVTIFGVIGTLFIMVSFAKKRAIFEFLSVGSLLFPSLTLLILSSNSESMSYGHRYMLTSYLVIFPGVGFALTYIKNRQKQWVRWTGLILFSVCLWVGMANYLLFHTNSNTLTLTKHPVFAWGKDYPEGLLSNPQYDRNATRVIFRNPIQPLFSLSASLGGAMAYSLVKRFPLGSKILSIGPLKKVAEYHERKRVPWRVILFYLIGAFIGTLFIGFVTILLARGSLSNLTLKDI